MWIIYTLLSSWINCAYYFGNQTAKIAPNVFMFYRGLVPVLVLSFFFPYIKFIEAWQFYAACVFQGLIVSFIDYRQFRAIRVWGAERVSAIYPFCLCFVFIFWLVLKPSDIITQIEHPFRLLGIIVALCGVFFSVYNYRQSYRSKQALQYLLPFILASGLCDAMNKFSMSYVPQPDLISGSLLYVWIQSLVIAVVNFIIYSNKTGSLSDLYQWQNIKYSPLIILNILAGIFKNFAMFNTPNPSYVTALMYLYIIWIMIVARVLMHFGIKCRHNELPPQKVLLLLASSIVIALLGQ